MPYNGTGTFNPDPTNFPAVPDTTIQAAKFNNLIADIASGLSVALTRDGQSTATAALSMGGYRIQNLGAPATTNDAVSLSYADNRYAPKENPSFTGNLSCSGRIISSNNPKIWVRAQAFSFFGTANFLLDIPALNVGGGSFFTPGSYIVPVSGYYHIGAGLSIRNSQGKRATLFIRVQQNSGATQLVTIRTAAPTDNTAHAFASSGIFYLFAGDRVYGDIVTGPGDIVEVEGNEMSFLYVALIP